MRACALIGFLAIAMRAEPSIAETQSDITASRIPDAPISFEIQDSVTGKCWTKASTAKSSGELIIRQSGIKIQKRNEYNLLHLVFSAYGGRNDNRESCLIGWSLHATSYENTETYGFARLRLFERAGVAVSFKNSDAQILEALEGSIKEFANEYLKMKDSGRIK